MYDEGAVFHLQWTGPAQSATDLKRITCFVFQGIDQLKTEERDTCTVRITDHGSQQKVATLICYKVLKDVLRGQEIFSFLVTTHF